DDKNVGSRSVSLDTLTLADGIDPDGGLASNYTLAGGTHEVTIGPRVISLSGRREYDGGVDLTAEIFALNNLVGGETLVLTGTGTMADKNVGSRTVTLDTLALADGVGPNGGLASNYTLVGGTHEVTIDPRVISLSGGREYDGSVDLAAAIFTLNNLAAG